ncbi:CZB domain-containing protein [Rufibacter roseolus]|uniref:CZB domain-containing protein n=1 Tax=Rufibacter roseolus TaxID=2817375 RepID=UPI001B300768|nr:CZB domain-containing protein [Rufibacter roseolus]
MDIRQARVKFILFKSKLRSILYGSPSDGSVLSARENSLGQWLYSSALQNYGHLPQIREIEKINLSITSIAKGLVNLYKGGKIEEARTGLSHLDGCEKELIRLLTEIESNA